MESNTLQKSTNNSVSSRFFDRIPSMIRRIVRIYEVGNQFTQKNVLIFLQNFLNFRSDMVDIDSMFG